MQDGRSDGEEGFLKRGGFGCAVADAVENLGRHQRTWRAWCQLCYRKDSECDRTIEEGAAVTHG